MRTDELITLLATRAAAERQAVRVGHCRLARQRTYRLQERRALAFAINVALAGQGHQDVPADIAGRLHQVRETGAIGGVQGQQVGCGSEQFVMHGWWAPP